MATYDTDRMLEAIFASLDAIGQALGVEVSNPYLEEQRAAKNADDYWAEGGQGYAQKHGLPWPPKGSVQAEAQAQAEVEDEDGDSDNEQDEFDTPNGAEDDDEADAPEPPTVGGDSADTAGTDTADAPRPPAKQAVNPLRNKGGRPRRQQ